jgi:hypothetical protein
MNENRFGVTCGSATVARVRHGAATDGLVDGCSRDPVDVQSGMGCVGEKLSARSRWFAVSGAQWLHGLHGDLGNILDWTYSS